MPNMHLEEKTHNIPNSNGSSQDRMEYAKPARVIFDLTKNVVHNDSDASDDDEERFEPNKHPLHLPPGRSNGYLRSEDDFETAQLVYHLDHNLIYSDSEDSYTSIDGIGDTGSCELSMAQDAGLGHYQKVMEKEKVSSSPKIKDVKCVEKEVQEDTCYGNEILYGRKANNYRLDKKNGVQAESYANKNGKENDKNMKVGEESDLYMKDKMHHAEATNIQNVASMFKLDSKWEHKENIGKKQQSHPSTHLEAKEGRSFDVHEGDKLSCSQDTNRDNTVVFSNVVRVIQDAQKSLDTNDESVQRVMDVDKYRTYKVEMEWIKVQQLGMVTFQQDY